ncbi:unnamed protein product [Cylicostephanus goldi]|uniref:Uncharacterized protein n=1 Tax=Cylicostephanus goldi TaxID=71465 RepID=A0A3P7QVG1_CYLGO|nr:unnamed protein product [Cylicostephanus goldi]
MISLWTSEETLGCNYKVYQKPYYSYHTREAYFNQMDLFWGIAEQINTDTVALQPYHDFAQSIVMHLTNFRLETSPERVSTALTVRAIRDNKPVTVGVEDSLEQGEGSRK